MAKCKYLLLLLFSTTFLFQNVNAQLNPGSKFKSVEDSLDCYQQISVYDQYLKKKYYDDAYSNWKKVISKYPDATELLYQSGIKIFERFIKKEKNKDKRQAYLDSLLSLYKQRIAYFNDEGFNKGRMGITLYRYGKYDSDNVQKAYDLIQESVKLLGNDAEASALSTLMQASKDLYKRGTLQDKYVIDNFVTSMDILSTQRKAIIEKINIEDYYTYLAEEDSLENLLYTKNEDIKYNKDNQKAYKDSLENASAADSKTKFETKIKSLKEESSKSKFEISSLEKTLKRYKRGEMFRLKAAELTIKNVETLLAISGAATCDILTNIFTPKFNENPNDIKTLHTITKILDNNGCDDNQLFTDAAEKLYELEPSAQAAYNIAKTFLKKGENTKAKEYYEKAVEIEEDDLAKAKYYYQLSWVNLSLKEYQSARKNALEAIKRNTSWGEPYLVIARAYAASAQSCGNDAFDKSAVYWAAVDKCIKAINVDKTIKRQAQKLIGQWSPYFPTKEEAFFRSKMDGDPHRVGCWINEATRVRTTK